MPKQTDMHSWVRMTNEQLDLLVPILKLVETLSPGEIQAVPEMANSPGMVTSPDNHYTGKQREALQKAQGLAIMVLRDELERQGLWTLADGWVEAS